MLHHSIIDLISRTFLLIFIGTLPCSKFIIATPPYLEKLFHIFIIEQRITHISNSIFLTSFSLQLVLLLFSELSEDYPILHPWGSQNKRLYSRNYLSNHKYSNLQLPDAALPHMHTLLLTSVKPETRQVCCLRFQDFVPHCHVSIFSLSLSIQVSSNASPFLWIC